MTSYIPMLVKGELYPVKVGGRTKAESKVKLTKEQDAELERAVIADDKKALAKLERQVMNVVIDDIRTAYMVWLKKDYSRNVPFSTKELIFVIAGKQVVVPIRSIQRYGKPPEKPTKTSAKAAWFGSTPNQVFMPFKSIGKDDLRTALKEGIKLFASFTLSGKRRKREPTNKPSVRGMSGDVNIQNPP